MFEREVGLPVPYGYEGAEAQDVLTLAAEAVDMIRRVSGWGGL